MSTRQLPLPKMQPVFQNLALTAANYAFSPPQTLTQTLTQPLTSLKQESEPTTNNPRPSNIPQETVTLMLTDFKLMNPLVPFSFGVLTGAILGLNGIIFLVIASIGFYNREKIIETFHTIIPKNYHNHPPPSSHDFNQSTKKTS